MREETTTRTLYTFQELSPEVQQELIEQEQQARGDDNFYSESVYEDAAIIAALFGLDINTRTGRNGKGETTYSPNIFYSGFWSQGDGACFEGLYQYKPGSVKAVKDYAPLDTTLHQIALDLQHAQAANFYRVTANIKHVGYYYYHSGCMSIDLENSADSYQEIKNEADFIQAFRDFADWIYNQLEEAYDYETSEENARDYLENDDQEYTADGTRA